MMAKAVVCFCQDAVASLRRMCVFTRIAQLLGARCTSAGGVASARFGHDDSSRATAQNGSEAMVSEGASLDAMRNDYAYPGLTRRMNTAPPTKPNPTRIIDRPESDVPGRGEQPTVSFPSI
jgi:hypothetical protein